MKKLALYAVAAVTVATGFTPSHAAPPPGGPVGRKCAFNSTTDVLSEAGRQTGDINGGPLVTGEAGTLHCDIHVGNNIHSGAVAAGGTAEADAIAGVVALVTPKVVNYAATAADDVSLCTTWVGASGTLYWIVDSQVLPGHWSPTPGSCGVALSIEPNDPECSIWLAIDQRAGTNIAEIWQDCEPYSPII
jgi:hypothetical protein